MFEESQKMYTEIKGQIAELSPVNSEEIDWYHFVSNIIGLSDRKAKERLIMKQIKSELYENHINYMENETFGDIDYTINKNEIRVSSYEGSTRFVNLKRKPYIELNQILELIKEVRKLSREQKVKIKGINRLKESVHNLYDEYSKEYRKYDEAFDILAVLWLNHVDKLKIGTRDDVIYQEVILKHQFDLEKYSYQSSILSRVDNIYSRLYNTSKQLKRENTLTMVQL